MEAEKKTKNGRLSRLPGRILFSVLTALAVGAISVSMAEHDVVVFIVSVLGFVIMLNMAIGLAIEENR